MQGRTYASLLTLSLVIALFLPASTWSAPPAARPAPAAPTTPAWQSFEAPPPALSLAGKGSLVICGGGKLPDECVAEFVRRAGGDEARIVVITTANWRADTAQEEILAMWRPRTKGKIILLHSNDRGDADSDDFVKPLREATGVWLMSGKQTKLAQAYRNSKVVAELKALLTRGGVVGGTSAGAAVMSLPMIAGGTLENPGVYEGFGLLPGAIIDQHFLVRKREPRLLKVLETMPGYFGIGIDEGAGLVVEGRAMKVIGESTVSIYLAPSSDRSRPLRVTQLKAGEVEDWTGLCRAAHARAAGRYPPETMPAPRVPHGSLVIVGGGRMPPDVTKKFIELAGGPDKKIVIVPTVAGPPERDALESGFLTRNGAKNVVVLHPAAGVTGPSAAADRAKLAEILKDAGGVWFGGGRQWNFVDAYEGTKMVDAFRDVLRRGGVIGGSSAGATIQGDYLVRGSPIVNTIMMAEGYERGFSFLPGAAIDQHFTQRKRGPDMELVKRTFPQLLGFGIDEGTAVVVRGSQFEVMGDHTVSVYPPVNVAGLDGANGSGATTTVAPPQVLKAGEKYDLEKFAPIK
jgi:cyanophycinase